VKFLPDLESVFSKDICPMLNNFNFFGKNNVDFDFFLRKVASDDDDDDDGDYEDDRDGVNDGDDGYGRYDVEDEDYGDHGDHGDHGDELFSNFDDDGGGEAF